MKTILLLLLFSFSIYSQNKINDISIIMGKWKLENDNFNLYEVWHKSNDSIFTGISYTVEDGKKNISERLYLLKLNKNIVYIAQPGNDIPTLFTLVDCDENKFVFENKEHDFPQRIIYHFISDSNLRASIEGEVKGTTKTREFNFKKAD